MSKNLLILSLFIFTGLKLSAQCTPDNNITKPGFYPNKLPDALLGIAYNEVIQFKIIKDTMVIVFGNPTKATIDSATITEVKGIPNGLTFQLNKTSKTYTPAETGCALVNGTPTKVGTFPLQIILLIYAKIGTFAIAQPDTIDNFSIMVKKDASVNNLDLTSNIFFPNPVIGNLLNINTKIILPGTLISVSNCQGQLLDSQKFDGGQQSILFDYPKGIYFLSLKIGDRVSRVKVVKE